MNTSVTDQMKDLECDAFSHQSGAASRITFFGIFGIQNLGNECTLQSILENVRDRHPETDIRVISFNPDDTRRRHNVSAFPVTCQKFGPAARSTGLLRPITRVFRLCRRIPRELRDWIKAVQTLRGTDTLIMTGTGMLTDYMTTALGFPYDVFRWSAAARLAGCKVRFVGIGVGPIYGRISRMFIKAALSLSDYRSFRDENSRNRIARIGFDTSRDHVFPDLVFSLPSEMLPQRKRHVEPVLRVGLGVMDHRDIHMWTSAEHEAQYSTYLDKMCRFVQWLVSHNYGVRILQGDAKHDAGTRAELKKRLESRGIRYDHVGIIDEGSATVAELIDQIADVDLVVSPRFHNLLLGLMLNIPGISISYDPKNDCLLEGVGLGNFTQPLTELNVDKLIAQFIELEHRLNEVRPAIEAKVRQYRALLDDQYEMIFAECGAHTRPVPA